VRARPTPEAFVKGLALEIGFSLFGIAGAVHSPVSISIYDDWLAAGKHAGQRYLAAWRDRRSDLHLLLPGARSVVSVALNYFPGRFEPSGPDSPGEHRGRFSIYARGRDYHRVMGERLERLAAAMSERFPGMGYAACVDNRPVAERTWALEAGIGWLGRNTCLITREFGSWVFLGELITDLDLQPDRPQRGSCGECRLCIEACPTGALGEDGTLDANRCLSYLTIEHRGDIPPRFHRAMADRVFGCDECQQVCPHNASVPPTRTPELERKQLLVDLSLESILNMEDRQLERLMKDSAVARIRPAGLKRNAGIVLANLDKR
jgi:epoxyqueuosine reductase